jgi:SAM-dependent methyltransferase
VTPERLDDLPPDDPLAIRSRRDLQRVHRAMGSVSILRRAVLKLALSTAPKRILELGAGDGTLLLRFARAVRPRWTGVELTLLDQQDLISGAVREAYRQLDWRVNVLQADALEWARSPPTQRYDLCVTTLFLHHFESENLRVLLAGVAAHTDHFAACEPRRSWVAQFGSRFIGLLGTNEVTREDGIKSVDAGFTDSELTGVWSTLGGDWRLSEYQAWPFTHCFLAARRGAGAKASPHDR